MLSRPCTLPDVPPTFAPFPDWARVLRSYEPIGEDADNAHFLAGAALAALHPIAMSGHLLGSLWRQRLALINAEAAIRLTGGREDVATLRDHLYLTRQGDNPGPAAGILLAWRLMAAPIARSDAMLLHKTGDLTGLFGIADEGAVNEAIGAMTGMHRPFDPLGRAFEAIEVSLKHVPDNRLLALWLADIALARALNWAAPVPLLAAHLKREDWRYAIGPHADADRWRFAIARAYQRGTVAAFDLYTDLARRAERLLAVAHKLRGKDADETILKLLSEDALAAQAGTRTTDRSGRRLFDKLVELGAVRELTGRSTFRLYGL